MIAIPVPHDVGRLFRSVDVPGERDPSDHITLFYLGDDVPLKTIIKAIEPTFKVTSDTKPFTVSSSKITTFKKGDDGYPVIARLDSKELHEFHSKLKRALKKEKVNFSDKYPEYKPHVTLGYCHDEKIDDIKIDKVSWLVDEIAIYGGDSHDERIYISFPLNLNILKKSSSYIFSIVSTWKNKVER